MGVGYVLLQLVMRGADISPGFGTLRRSSQLDHDSQHSSVSFGMSLNSGGKVGTDAVGHGGGAVVLVAFATCDKDIGVVGVGISIKHQLK